MLATSCLSDDALMRLLEDDTAYGDLTTETLAIGAAQGRFEFRARHAMCVCSVEEALRMCQLAGLQSEALARSGDALSAGQPILTAAGSAAALHRAWKAAQVLVEWASGIASASAEIVATASGTPVACTRKNVPGTKTMSIKAVRAGGATIHRLGLSETLLVFPEHRLFLDETPEVSVARLKRQQPEKKVVVEVGDIESALRWASAGADVLQLEKFSPASVATCRASLLQNDLHPLLAAAGGVSAANAAAYVAAGADLLVTSAPYSAPPRDVAVRFFPC